jgi:hypothetical protein
MISLYCFIIIRFTLCFQSSIFNDFYLESYSLQNIIWRSKGVSANRAYYLNYSRQLQLTIL